MPANSAAQSFIIAPFGIDGVMEGKAKWKIADLSPKWTGICSDLIAATGPSLDHSLGGPLSHLRIRSSDTDGATHITISVHDRPVSLAALASGKSSKADANALASFFGAILEASARFRADNRQAFGDMMTMPDRPLLVVVPWPDELISDQEHDLARELMLHFTAALLLHA